MLTIVTTPEAVFETVISYEEWCGMPPVPLLKRKGVNLGPAESVLWISPVLKLEGVKCKVHKVIKSIGRVTAVCWCNNSYESNRYTSDARKLATDRSTECAVVKDPVHTSMWYWTNKTRIFIPVCRACHSGQGKCRWK